MSVSHSAALGCEIEVTAGQEQPCATIGILAADEWHGRCYSLGIMSGFSKKWGIRFAAALSALLAIGGVSDSEAGIRVHGHVHIRGGIRVSAPRVRYYPRPVVRWWPSYVVYEQPYQEPAPIYVSQAPASPGAYAPARQPLPQLAVGGFLGVAELRDAEGSALGNRGERGLLLHARVADHWHLEGALRQASDTDSNLGRDTYAGIGVLGELFPRATISPYGVVAVGREFTDRRSYAELGGGLRLGVGPSVELSADLRSGGLSKVDLEADGARAADLQAAGYSRLQIAALVRF